MNKATRGVVLLAIFLVALALAVPAFARNEEARVRVAHLSADAPNVDVYIDGKPVESLTDVSFKTVSPYLPVSAGAQNVKVYSTGDKSEPVVDADVEIRDGASYTIGVVGLVEDGSLAAQVYEDDGSPPAKGNAKLRVVHSAPDVEVVDIAPQGSEDGEDLFVNLGFPNATKYAEVPAGTYTLEIEPTGTGKANLAIPDATLPAGEVVSAFVVGRAEKETLEVLVVSDAEDTGEQLDVARLSVVGTARTDQKQEIEAMPATGGVSPLLLASGLILLGTVGYFATRRRKV